MSGPFDLERFVSAQEKVFPAACAELANGKKRSHWMWFVFPQLRGLGASPTAQHYGLASLAEARAYLAHPVLGARLRQVTQLLNELQGVTASQVFGYPDDLKLRSCLTLFAEASTNVPAEQAANAAFAEALERYFAGEEDPLTRKLLMQKT